MKILWSHGIRHVRPCHGSRDSRDDRSQPWRAPSWGFAGSSVFCLKMGGHFCKAASSRCRFGSRTRRLHPVTQQVEVEAPKPLTPSLPHSDSEGNLCTSCHHLPKNIQHFRAVAHPMAQRCLSMQHYSTCKHDIKTVM